MCHHFTHLVGQAHTDIAAGAGCRSDRCHPPSAMPSQIPSFSLGTRRMPHARLIMLLLITAAVALTYMVPSGRCERRKMGLVVPGTFPR